MASIFINDQKKFYEFENNSKCFEVTQDTLDTLMIYSSLKIMLPNSMLKFFVEIVFARILIEEGQLKVSY